MSGFCTLDSGWSKCGRNHKISGSPVAGPVFSYSTGKTDRVGKYATAHKLLAVSRLCQQRHWSVQTNSGLKHIRDRFTCDTSSLVYVITCSKCNRQSVCRRDGKKIARENEWPSGRRKKQEQHACGTAFQTTLQNLRRGKNTLTHNSEESPRKVVDRTSWIIQNIQMHEPALGHWLASSVIAQFFLYITLPTSLTSFFSPHFTHSCTPSPSYLTHRFHPSTCHL